MVRTAVRHYTLAFTVSQPSAVQVAVLVVTAVIAGVRHPQARFRLEHVTHDLSLCNTNKPECISVGYVASAAVTVCGRLSVKGAGLPRGCAYWGYLLKEGVCSGGSSLGGVHPQTRGRPACGETDRCLWKHYFSVTTVADGKYQK